MMDIQIERNQRFGYGLQIRFIDGPFCETYDDEPLTLSDAMELIHEFADECLGGAMPSQIMIGPAEPLAAASGPGVVAFQPQPDVREAVVDGEMQPVVSARGVVLLAWAGWKESGSEQSKNAMRRYCEYISAHGYRGGASKAMVELEEMDFNCGAKWIKRTFAKYVRDKTAAMRYVLPQT